MTVYLVLMQRFDFRGLPFFLLGKSANLHLKLCLVWAKEKTSKQKSPSAAAGTGARRSSDFHGDVDTFSIA